jgi:hypothetical protein
MKQNTWLNSDLRVAGLSGSSASYGKATAIVSTSMHKTPENSTRHRSYRPTQLLCSKGKRICQEHLEDNNDDVVSEMALALQLLRVVGIVG